MPISEATPMASVSTVTTELPPSQEWKDLLEEILPPQGQWSEEQYLILTDHRNRLIEFTDGFLEVLPSPTDKHQSILEFLFLAFLNFIRPRGGKVRFATLRLRIRPRKFREPDLLLLLSAPIRAAKTASGWVPIWPWKLLVKISRNGTWSTSGATMPRAVSRNTGSSTRRQKP